MVSLNILIFDFNPHEIFLRLLVPPKNFIYEISPNFFVKSRLTFLFFNEFF